MRAANSQFPLIDKQMNVMQYSNLTITQGGFEISEQSLLENVSSNAIFLKLIFEIL